MYYLQNDHQLLKLQIILLKEKTKRLIVLLSSILVGFIISIVYIYQDKYIDIVAIILFFLIKRYIYIAGIDNNAPSRTGRAIINKSGIQSHK